VLLVAPLSGACGGGDRPAERALARAGSDRGAVAEERRTILTWLECEECVDGELDAVVALGPSAVPTLAATLREGPSPAARTRAEIELRQRHAELTEAARLHGDPLPIDADGLVAQQLENAVARYQVRSAEALAEIGGPVAEQALRDALARPLRSDVELFVRDRLERLTGPPPP
jgi:hypothetical protein